MKFSTDIIGILVENYGLETSNNGTLMRDIILTDTTKEMIVTALWGSQAESFACEKFSVIIIKNGIVIEFKGKNKLNALSGTLIWV